MLKCNFCTQSNSNGVCPWDADSKSEIKSKHCGDALTRMRDITTSNNITIGNKLLGLLFEEEKSKTKYH